MNAMEKIISFILLTILLSTVHVDSKPCSNSSSECQQVRMPLVSNKLNAPLVAELDITSMNQQLKTYIDDNIYSTFSEDVHDMVKNELNNLKTSMLKDYSSKLTTTEEEYDKQISKMVRSLNTTRDAYDQQLLNMIENFEAKQDEVHNEMSEVSKDLNATEANVNAKIADLLNGFEQRQESVKLAMLSEYLSKLQTLQDTKNKQITDLASDLKSQFADLTEFMKGKFIEGTAYLQTQKRELEEWKTNLTKKIEEIYAPLKFKDCSLLRFRKPKPNGVYTIYPDEMIEIQVYCDMTTDGGGWTVIQRRIDGTTSFDRNWHEYREGFGDPQKEYWLGNKYLNMLTTNGKYELRVDLTDTNNKMTYAVYKTFTVSDENSKYTLTIGGHSGTAMDGMAYNNGMKFTTKDRDNDHKSSGNCAKMFGGWWHGYCSLAKLNNDMSKNKLYWRGSYIKSSMMIRQIM